jgi:uncharacterized protein (TIGR02271 family)
MVDTSEIQPLLGRNGQVLDDSGEKIGKIGQVYLDDATGQPEWVTVKTGLFGSSESFVPLADATIEGDDIRVRHPKSKVKDAPRMDADGHLSPDEEARLYEYYGLGYSTQSTETGYAAGGVSGGETRRDGDATISVGRTAGDVDTDSTYTTSERAGYTEGAEGTVGRDTSGPTTDDAMTRSEERVNVGTESVAAGKARLRKYVVTENVTQTVPVRREEVRLEREPITEGNRGAALDGPDISEEEHEVTLNEERVVVDKEAVPVERVRLDTETVTDEQQVSEEVRKEQIDVDDSDVTEGRRNR